MSLETILLFTLLKIKGQEQEQEHLHTHPPGHVQESK